MTDFGPWRELVSAGFPSVEHAGLDVEVEELGGDEPWEQPQLDIPGLKPVITAHGRKVPVVKGDDGATVADVAAYVDMCEQQHESRGKTLDKARESLATMREGCAGDETANAVEAWEAGIDDSIDESEHSSLAEAYA